MTNSSSPLKREEQQLGLDHLVEAATALTQLVMTRTNPNGHTSPNPSASNNGSGIQSNSGSGNQISDDDSDTKSKHSSISALTMSSLSSAQNANGNSNSTSGAATGSSSGNGNVNGNTKEIFPQRLLRVLSNQSISDIITWLPHGRAFVILKPDDLAASVLPEYFPESCSSTNGGKALACKYPSFTRKLNRWGFRQVTRGPDSGAFHHKYFIREEPELCHKMVCQRSKRRKGADKAAAAVSVAKGPTGVGGLASFTSNAASLLGPYSAALRRQSMDSDSFSDSINVNLNHNNHQFLFQPHTLHALSNKLTQDQNTFVSARSCNVKTPPPMNFNNHALGNFNGNENDMMNNQSSNHVNSSFSSSQNSPSGAPTNMVRTISNTSSTPTSAFNVNTNISFPTIFNNENGQLNPRLLLSQNVNVASSVNSVANSVGNLTSYNNNVAALASAFNQFPSNVSTNSLNQQHQQHQTMPNYITFFDKHAHSNNTSSNNNNNNIQQEQMNQQLLPLAPQPVQNQNMQMQQSQVASSNNKGNTNQNCSNYHTPILPVGAPSATVPNSTNATSNNYQVALTATGIPNSTNVNNNSSSNATVVSNHSIPCNAPHMNMSTATAPAAATTAITATGTSPATNNGAPQIQQQQTEAELRAANAKTLLYNAYLEALG